MKDIESKNPIQKLFLKFAQNEFIQEKCAPCSSLFRKLSGRDSNTGILVIDSPSKDSNLDLIDENSALEIDDEISDDSICALNSKDILLENLGLQTEIASESPSLCRDSASHSPHLDESHLPTKLVDLNTSAYSQPSIIYEVEVIDKVDDAKIAANPLLSIVIVLSFVLLFCVQWRRKRKPSKESSLSTVDNFEDEIEHIQERLVDISHSIIADCQESLSETAVIDDELVNHKDFWNYVAYYGEDLAREYYGDSAPPAGAEPPEGFVSYQGNVYGSSILIFSMLTWMTYPFYSVASRSKY